MDKKKLGPLSDNVEDQTIPEGMWDYMMRKPSPPLEKRQMRKGTPMDAILATDVGHRVGKGDRQKVGKRDRETEDSGITKLIKHLAKPVKKR